MQYPKILFGKFCTMIRHEQSVWPLIPSFLTPDQNLSGKKFPMKIEKALQAPITFFSRKVVPECITGTLLLNKNQCSAFIKFASPQKNPKHSLRAESAWQPFFGPRKGFCLLKDGKKRLKEALKLKRPSSWRQKNLRLSENCKVHKACNIQAVIQECSLTELRHSSIVQPRLLFVQKTKKKN
jgi:hypothetical protein